MREGGGVGVTRLLLIRPEIGNTVARGWLLEVSQQQLPAVRNPELAKVVTKVLQLPAAFCFTALRFGTKLGSSLRGVTYAKALHRAAYLHRVAGSSAANAGAQT